jgi:hypothetical protein
MDDVFYTRAYWAALGVTASVILVAMVTVCSYYRRSERGTDQREAAGVGIFICVMLFGMVWVAYEFPTPPTWEYVQRAVLNRVFVCGVAVAVVWINHRRVGRRRSEQFKNRMRTRIKRPVDSSGPDR